jgi:hypothetical protein
LDEHINVTEKLIPFTFEEETNLLYTDSIAALKKHYMACCRQGKMTQYSLIGCTISTRSKKDATSASKISLPSVLSEDTEISKTSEELTHMISTLSI